MLWVWGVALIGQERKLDLSAAGSSGLYDPALIDPNASLGFGSAGLGLGLGYGSGSGSSSSAAAAVGSAGSGGDLFYGAGDG
jgi:hypothetical protein